MNNASLGLLAPQHLLPVLNEALGLASIPVCFSFDPTGEVPQTTPAAKVILVVLSPAIEDALDEYEDLLYADGQQAMFDEDQDRSGWDATRWSAHLAPKLSPLLKETALESNLATDVDLPALDRADDEQSEPTPLNLPIADYPADNAPLEGLSGLTWSQDEEPQSPAPMAALELDLSPSFKDAPIDSQHSLDSGLEAGWEADADSPLFNLSPSLAIQASEPADTQNTTNEGMPTGSHEEPIPEALTIRLSLDMSDESVMTEPALVEPVKAASFSTKGLSLVMDDGESVDIHSVKQSPEPNPEEESPAEDFVFLETSDPEDWTAPKAEGFVLIAGGMGGPGAIREILSHLNEKMPVPVLIIQPMPQGRYEVLANNLGKHASIPVEHATMGAQLTPGKAWVMGEGLAPEANDEGLWVAQEGCASTAIVRAGETQSAILMVSGAGQDLIFPAMEAMACGALLFGQEPDRAYEAHTIEALMELGLVTGTPTMLGIHLAEHWGITDVSEASGGAST